MSHVEGYATSALAARAMSAPQVRKGSLVYWEISELSTSKEVLSGLGLGEFLPRNDAKSSLIKALKLVTRGNPMFYKRFADHGAFVRFTVVNPETVAVTNAAGQQDVDLNFQKEITISLEKSSGMVTLVSGARGVEYQPSADDLAFFEQIKGLYEHERFTIDSNQFRAVLVRFIRTKGFGVAMRSRGGIYFVDERKADVLATLQTAFERFRGRAKLYSLSMYDEEGTRVAVRDAAVENIVGEIDEAVRSLREQVEEAQQEAFARAAERTLDLPPNTSEGPVRAKLGTRTIRSKQEAAAEILERIAFYRESLAEMGGELERRAKMLRETVQELGQDIPESFSDMLGRI